MRLQNLQMWRGLDCTSAAPDVPHTQMLGMLGAAVLEEDDLDLYTDVLPHRVHALCLGCLLSSLPLQTSLSLYFSFTRCVLTGLAQPSPRALCCAAFWLWLARPHGPSRHCWLIRLDIVMGFVLCCSLAGRIYGRSCGPCIRSFQIACASLMYLLELAWLSVALPAGMVLENGRVVSSPVWRLHLLWNQITLSWSLLVSAQNRCALNQDLLLTGLLPIRNLPRNATRVGR